MKKNSNPGHDDRTTVKEALRTANYRLTRAGADTPYLDSLLLLGSVLQMSKEELYMRHDDMLAGEKEQQFTALLEKREAGVPVSYLRRRKEFWDMEFYIDERVLVPRPDTETLVEEALSLLEADKSLKTVHDVCTGSGCVAIALKKTLPGLTVTASDISEEALEVCRINSINLLGSPLPSYRSDLLTEVPGRFDIITANPPYLTTSETILMKSGGTPEPAGALDGGKDGLDTVKKLTAESLGSLRNWGYLILEAAEWQIPEIEKIFRQYGYTDTRIRKDLAGRPRVIRGRKPER
ncbi:MAG: peptide chain release factor N(5)-glutamine methyltransferase [Spirochaetia bacterium]